MSELSARLKHVVPSLMQFAVVTNCTAVPMATRAVRTADTVCSRESEKIANLSQKWRRNITVRIFSENVVRKNQK